MKRGIVSLFLAIFLLYSSSTFAANYTNIYLTIGSSTVLDNKNISLVTFTNNKFVFDVDGITNIVNYPEGYINGVKIRVNGIFVNAANFNFSMNFKCGDKICSRSEDSKICCMDCNCTEGLACVSNICISAKCREDYECEDKSNCTKDYCSDKLECVNEEIGLCSTGDGCCSAKCDFRNDFDCKKEGQCLSNKECNDNDPCTEDKCNGNCSHKSIGGCLDAEKCVPLGTLKNETYCSNDGWQQRKENGVGCTKDYECLAGKCVANICGGKTVIEAQPKKENESSIKGLVVLNVIVVFTIVLFYVIFKLRKQE